MELDQTLEGAPRPITNAPDGGVAAFTSPPDPTETPPSIAGAARRRAASSINGGPAAALRPATPQ